MNIYFLNDYNFINHRLTSVKNGDATAMTVTYSANGNIASKTGIGAYSYSTSRPHAVVGVENISRVISSEYQSVTYTPFNKVQTITQANKKLTIKYGPDKQRVKTIYTNGIATQTRIYAGSYERLTQNGTTTGYQYIYSPDGLVGIYVKPSNSNGTMYYATTDHLGSLLRLYNADGTQTYAASYDAWGKQTITKNTFNLRRGYCQHEHWNEFGLIDMNGRFYDPVLGRFLSPDPYVQDAANPQNFNRYSYCMNNPLKYTDPSGEFWHIVIGAVIGGVANLVANWNNCDGFWQYATAFTAGAGAGALTAATGGAGASIWAVGGVAAAGGAATCATNSIIAQTGNNFDGMSNVNWNQVGVSAGIGCVSGFAGGVIGGFAGEHIGGFAVNGMNISSPIAKGVIMGAVGGMAGGAVGGYVGGYLATGSNDLAKESAWKGMWQGAAIGSISGGLGAYASAKNAGVNPWTGDKISLTTTESVDAYRIGNTIERIDRGELLDYRNDGILFRNNEGHLPIQEDGYYHEYVHPIEGGRFPGAHRIITGANGEIYYTPDHYRTFIKIR